jgi:hypothetical protein
MATFKQLEEYEITTTHRDLGCDSDHKYIYEDDNEREFYEVIAPEFFKAYITTFKQLPPVGNDHIWVMNSGYDHPTIEYMYCDVIGGSISIYLSWDYTSPTNKCDNCHQSVCSKCGNLEHEG